MLEAWIDADGYTYVRVQIDGRIETWVLTANDRKRAIHRAKSRGFSSPVAVPWWKRWW